MERIHHLPCPSFFTTLCLSISHLHTISRLFSPCPANPALTLPTMSHLSPPCLASPHHAQPLRSSPHHAQTLFTIPACPHHAPPLFTMPRLSLPCPASPDHAPTLPTMPHLSPSCPNITDILICNTEFLCATQMVQDGNATRAIRRKNPIQQKIKVKYQNTALS